MPTKKAKWSKQVTEHSDAMTLESGVFSQKDPKKIAASIKRSAQHSKRLKGTPFQSAMSMLNFYVNRAGSHLSETQRHQLQAAKAELRRLFDKPSPKSTARKAGTKHKTHSTHSGSARHAG